MQHQGKLTQTTVTAANCNYRIGLPAWAFPGWNSLYFNNKPSTLASYAKVFNTVEGNTTFYSIPDEKTVQLWHDAVAETDFQFCFKLPKTVTHNPRPNLNLDYSWD